MFQDENRLVTVPTHADFIVLLHCDTRPPALLKFPLSRIIVYTVLTSPRLTRAMPSARLVSEKCDFIFLNLHLYPKAGNVVITTRIMRLNGILIVMPAAPFSNGA